MKLIHWIFTLAITAVAVFGALILYRRYKEGSKPLSVADAASKVEAMAGNGNGTPGNTFKFREADNSILYNGMGPKNMWS